MNYCRRCSAANRFGQSIVICDKCARELPPSWWRGEKLSLEPILTDEPQLATDNELAETEPLLDQQDQQDQTELIAAKDLEIGRLQVKLERCRASLRRLRRQMRLKTREEREKNDESDRAGQTS